MFYNQTVGLALVLAGGFILRRTLLKMISRRDFLAAVSGGAAAAMLPGFAWAANPGIEIPGKAGMIVRSARFLDLEMPLEFFDSWITPVPHFFVRNHMHEPASLDVDELDVEHYGEVETPAQPQLCRLGETRVALQLPTHWSARETDAVFSNPGFPACNGNAAR